MTGVVYKSTGSWYTVKDETGRFWSARMKGVFKIDEITSTNPVSVGDKVEIEKENEIEYTALITKIHDRTNYINRQSPRAKYQQHIVAANIDLSLALSYIERAPDLTGFY